MPQISVIVPNYEGRKVFPDCVRSLLKQDHKSFEILLVDDGSTDGSVALAKQLFGKEKRVRIVEKKTNTGYVGACNEGVKKARGTYVLVTNNDATFAKNWLTEMHRSVGKTQISSTLVLSQKKNDPILEVVKRGKYGLAPVLGMGAAFRDMTSSEQQSGIVDVFAAGSFMLQKSALKGEIFDSDYFAYGEDVALCWRFRLKGWNVVANTRAYMYHIGSYTRKTNKAFNKRALYHGTKNRIMNFFIFWEFWTLVRLFPLFFLTQLGLFLLGPRAMYLRLGAYWWLIKNIGKIRKKRRTVQKSRIVSDRELLTLMSYRFGEYDTNVLVSIISGVVTGLSWVYYKIVFIKTGDM